MSDLRSKILADE